MYTLRIFFLIALTSGASIAAAQSAPLQNTVEPQPQTNACYVNGEDSEQPTFPLCTRLPGKSSSQVYEELQQAKEAGYVTFGELDYPPLLATPRKN